jgi:predicted nucleic-acid-binding protein
MVAADTNVLVRLLTGDDPRQTVIAERFIEPTAWVSVLALAEAIWVLGKTYKISPKEIGAGAQMLLRHKNLIVQDADAMVAALELFRSRPSLGFSDCAILEIARKEGNLPLGTFDRALGKVDGTIRL